MSHLAGTETENFKIAIPDSGKSPWHLYYQELATVVDALIGRFVVLANFRGLWVKSTRYELNERIVSPETGLVYNCTTAHTSPATGTHADELTNNPSRWAVWSMLTGVGALASRDTITTTHIDNGAVTFAKIADVASNVILGRNDAGSGSVEALTAAEVLTLLGITAIGTATDPLPIVNGGTAATTAADARTNLGLGTIATQNANAVAITGGSITGITDLAIADGGTGASTAVAARSNLGLGTAATQNTGTSGATVPLLNTNVTWSAASMTVVYADDGAAGPGISLWHNSASPAANDVVGTYSFLGNDNAANLTTFCYIQAAITDPTDTSEDGFFVFGTTQAGAAGTRCSIGGGVYHPSATSTDMGNNTINFGAIYDDGKQLSKVLVSTASPSAGSSADFSGLLTSTYPMYLIEFDLVVSVDGAAIYLRTDSDAGASYDAGASDYRYAMEGRNDGGTTTAVNSTGTTQYQLTEAAGSGVGNATNECIHGTVFIVRGSASKYPLFVANVVYLNASTSLRSMQGGGARNSAAAIDSVRILPSSGNITGTVKLYGLL